MLGRVTAVEVIREAKSGRTRPVLMLCETDTDGAVEAFCKLSAGCFEGVTSLAREVVAACMGFPFAVKTRSCIIPSDLRQTPRRPWTSGVYGVSSASR